MARKSQQERNAVSADQKVAGQSKIAHAIIKNLAKAEKMEYQGHTLNLTVVGGPDICYYDRESREKAVCFNLKQEPTATGEEAGYNMTEGSGSKIAETFRNHGIKATFHSRYSPHNTFDELGDPIHSGRRGCHQVVLDFTQPDLTAKLKGMQAALSKSQASAQTGRPTQTAQTKDAVLTVSTAQKPRNGGRVLGGN